MTVVGLATLMAISPLVARADEFPGLAIGQTVRVTKMPSGPADGASPDSQPFQSLPGRFKADVVSMDEDSISLSIGGDRSHRRASQHHREARGQSRPVALEGCGTRTGRRPRGRRHHRSRLWRRRGMPGERPDGGRLHQDWRQQCGKGCAVRCGSGSAGGRDHRRSTLGADRARVCRCGADVPPPRRGRANQLQLVVGSFSAHLAAWKHISSPPRGIWPVLSRIPSSFRLPITGPACVIVTRVTWSNEPSPSTD